MHFSINSLNFINFLYDNQFYLWKESIFVTMVAMEIIILHKFQEIEMAKIWG